VNARLLCFILLALTAAVILAARITGPSDLTTKTQPKTIAYTADMLVNGRWLLPRHTTGELATKPPLFNWCSVPFVAAFDLWDEWAHKMPSILSGLASAALCAWMTAWMWKRRSRERDDDALDPSASGVDPWALGFVAAAMLLAAWPMFKQIYIARPDMLMSALLTASWALATVILQRAAEGAGRRRTLALSLGLWLCVGATALTKGPTAALPAAYIPLAALLIHRRFALVHATGWWWGIPLAIAMFAAWLIPVYRIDPEHVRTTLLGSEITDRVSGGSAGELIAGIWKMPLYFLGRFAPWSIAAVLALIHLRPRAWLRSRFAPAILWLLLVLIAFTLPGGRLSRYLLPMYPAVAALAAYFVVVVGRKYRITAPRAALAALLVAIGLAAYQFIASTAAETQYGERNKAFAAEIRPIIGDDSIVIRTHYSEIIIVLLGRHQAGKPTDEQLATADWEIIGYKGQDGVIAHSDVVVIRSNGKPGRLGLRRRSGAGG
jgi:4-amino-4-deoxy-L-arabinose transferase-like glycosyltransferase